MSELTPLARLLRADRQVPAAPAPAPAAVPPETPEEAHARGLAEGQMMLETALADASVAAIADRAHMQAAMAAAVDALADAFAAEIGALAYAMAAHVLVTVPEAAEQALAAILADLATTGAAGTELRAHPDSVAVLDALCAGTGVSVTPDPALSAGMVAAPRATGERVDSLAMRMARLASAVLEHPA